MKKYMRYLSFVLAISIIFTLFSGFTNVSASGEDLSVSLENIETIDNESLSEPFIIEEATVEYLEADAFPAVLEKSEIQEKQYVGRVKGEERNEYTLVLKNADGSNTLRLFDYPVKYIDETGEEKDITLKLTETAKGGYRTSDNKIITTFSQKLSDGISLEYEDISIQMVPEEQGLSLTPITPITPIVPAASAELSTVTELTPITPVTPVREASLSEDKEKISYPFGNKTTLEYTLTYTGFKEDIVVEEYTGQTKYTFRLYTNGLTLVEEEGSYYLANKNNEIKATIGDIIIFTADERNNTFGSMTYETITANEEYLMTIHVDADYLKDEKTVYPIRIDPTLEINYSNNGAAAIEDVTINYLTGSNATSTSLMVGKRETYGMSRILMKFPGLNLNSFSSDTQIVSASVELRDILCESAAMDVFCYAYTGGAWDVDTVTWKGINTLTFSDATESMNTISYANGRQQNPYHRYGFDLTKTVKGWINGTYLQEKGIIFKASYPVEMDSSLIHKTFASYNRSTNKPSLTVTYNPVLTISVSSVSMLVDATRTITASTYPAMTVTWSSYNTDVATVTNAGKITALKEGMTTITARCTDADGNIYSATCKVYVKIPNGVYKIWNLYSDLLLHVEDWGITNGSNVYQYSEISTEIENLCQLWKIQYIGSGYYSIRPMNKLDMGLYANGYSATIYEIGSQNTTSNVPSYARWTIEDTTGAGGYVIKRLGSSTAVLSLATTSSAEETDVVIQTYGNYRQQMWYLEKVESPPNGVVLYDLEEECVVNGPIRYIAGNETLSLDDLDLLPISYNANSNTQAFIWVVDKPQNISIDENTGTVTGLLYTQSLVYVTASIYISGQTYTATYYLKTTPIANGVYYIKSKYSNKFLDIEGGTMSEGTNICQWEYNGNNTQKWEFIRYDGEYYMIKSTNSNTAYYLGVEGNSTDQDANVILKSTGIGNGMKWKIEATTSGAYKITPKSGEASHRVLAVEHGNIIGDATANGKKIQQRNYVYDDNYRDEWYLEGYKLILNLYYDNAFNVRYTNGNQVINELSESASHLLGKVLGLRAVFNSPTMIRSTPDNCKLHRGLTINSTTINTMCPGNPSLNNPSCPYFEINAAGDEDCENCTSWNQIYKDFIENHPGDCTAISVLFTGNKLYDDEGNLCNRSYLWYNNGIVLQEIRSNSSEYLQTMLSGFLHEISHGIGAPDHYHEVVEDENGNEFCTGGNMCLECYPLTGRSSWCIMNAGWRTDLMTANIDMILCTGCKNDIIEHLGNGYHNV